MKFVRHYGAKFVLADVASQIYCSVDFGEKCAFRVALLVAAPVNVARAQVERKFLPK